jgi:hypothetical protein
MAPGTRASPSREFKPMLMGMMEVKLMFDLGATETVQPATISNKRQRTTQSQRQTPIIILDEKPAPQPNFEAIQAGLDQLKRQQENTKRENERLLAEVEVLRTYKQQQEVKEQKARDIAAKADEEIRAIMRHQPNELDMLRANPQQQEYVQCNHQDISTRLEQLCRAHKQLQEAVESNERVSSARLEELCALELQQEDARELRDISDPTQRLKKVQAIKLKKLARVQEIKDQMKATDCIHDASLRFELDQENEILQQAIKFVEEVTGLQRNIKYAQRQLQGAFSTYLMAFSTYLMSEEDATGWT